MRTRQGGTALLARPNIVAKRDHRVSVLSVPCPICKVDVGVKCVNAAGQTSSTRHDARRRMAVRLDNELRGL